MLRKIDWESQIGRRLKLRDLHVFCTAVRSGSMAKAAALLGVSQPAVSEVVADLEHALGVRLLDRHSQGVEPTLYGAALLKRSVAAFDELKQSIRDIEFLADPTAGELRVGCPESLSSGILPQVIRRFSQSYPRVVLHVDQVVTPALEMRELLERRLDLVLARTRPPGADALGDELNIETVCHDQLLIAAAKASPWARRRKIDIAELAGEPWILQGPGTWVHQILADAFRSRGLGMPHISLVTFSIHLRAGLLEDGSFLTALPESVLRFHAERFALKALPVSLPQRPWPVLIMTLKNRTLSPVVERFIDCVREVAKSFGKLGDRGTKLPKTALRSQ
jgi:DNA-binding transcriptional LysR family regulator